MTPWVLRLIVANIAMFALQAVTPIDYRLFVLVPSAALFRPWTLVTYMFLHGGLTHLLFNMLGLFFFGSRVELRLGSARFLTLYFIAGVSGALLSLPFTPDAQIIGASGGVFGVMMAFAMFWPRERIYIWGILPIEARVLVIVTTAMALYAGLGGGRSGIAHFAHLGGYLGAYLYLRWHGSHPAIRRFRAKVDATPPAIKRAATLTKDHLDLRGVHEITKGEVDRILDKISAHGMASLTPEEARFLSNFAPLDDRKPPPVS
jgi:membrane associated rhomboid family serine protease